MLEAFHVCLAKSLGLTVHLLVMRSPCKVFNSILPANRCKELSNKLGSVFREQVGWDPKLNYPVIKEQVCKMRRVCIRR